MLTKECANCPFWIDTENASGCGYVRPISECKAFARKFEEQERDNTELESEGYRND